MARKSGKENKNVYQLSREDCDMSRAEASEKLFISEDSLERIEREAVRGGRKPSPDEVVSMAKLYKKYELCNYYCANECAIGQCFVPEIQIRSLPDIAIGMMVQLNRLTKDKDRFLEIIEDGNISPDERADFLAIKDNLDKMAITIESFRVWLNNAAESGKIDAGLLNLK